MVLKRRAFVLTAIAFSVLVAAGLLTTCLNEDDGTLPLPGISKELLPAGVEKFQKLDDMLYRGAQPDGRGFRDLERKLGIRTVIDLRNHHGETKMLAGTSLAYNNIGMKAWHAEDEDVIEFLKLVKHKWKGPFFIHCKHGVDRTGFMCAIYRIVAQGWDKEKALAERRRFRPHRIWKNLERYIRKMDVEAIRKKVGL
jgi:protein tyrosine/serine phosphatase